MGIFARLFGKTNSKNRLEKFVDDLTPGSLNRKVAEVATAVKVPYAQTMTVFLFSRMFTKGLRKLAETLPEPFKTNWPYPHDRIFAEVAGFYYFVLLKDFMSHSDDDEDWDEEDEEPESDPYATSLRQSLYLCSNIVHSLSDDNIPKEFVINRALSFSGFSRSQNKNVVEEFAGAILHVWNPNHDGRPVLDLSAPIVPVQAYVAHLPIDDVVAACKGLYEEMSPA